MPTKFAPSGARDRIKMNANMVRDLAKEYALSAEKTTIHHCHMMMVIVINFLPARGRDVNACMTELVLNSRRQLRMRHWYQSGMSPARTEGTS